MSLQNEIAYLINEVEELRDIICNSRRIGIPPLQVLLVNLADSFHAIIDALIVRVSPRLRPRPWLHQQNCVGLQNNLVLPPFFLTVYSFVRVLLTIFEADLYDSF